MPSQVMQILCFQTVEVLLRSGNHITMCSGDIGAIPSMWARRIHTYLALMMTREIIMMLPQSLLWVELLCALILVWFAARQLSGSNVD